MKGSTKSEKVINTKNMTNNYPNMSDTHGFFLEMKSWNKSG